jgi:hypothetical protein
MPDQATTDQNICDAIRRLQLVGYLVVKDSIGLIVEPHCYGIGVDGLRVLWSWCIGHEKRVQRAGGMAALSLR